MGKNSQTPETENQFGTCADCGLELAPDKSWVCEDCSTFYAIFTDPNGYMTEGDNG